MMLKRGKAQGAMEFLMTYGWVIVVVIVILSALYFLGVFSPKTVSTCSIQTPFVCNDFIATDIGVTYSVGAKGISSATVTDIKINGQSCGGTIVNGNLNPNQITQVSCNGISLPTKQKVSAEIIISYTGRAGDLTHEIKGAGSGVSEFAASHPPTIQLSLPSNGAVNVNIPVTLQWDGNDLDGDTLFYDVYLNGIAFLLCQNIQQESCQLSGLSYETQYSWYIIVRDNEEAPVQSNTWSFTTMPVMGFTGNILYLHLDDQNIPPVDDVGPGNRDGNCNPGTTCPTLTQSGKLNSAYTFDGGSDVISGFGGAFDLRNKDFTISFWGKENNAGSTHYAVVGATGVIRLGRNGDNRYFYVGTPTVAIVSVVPPPGWLWGDWHHYVAVFKTGVEARLYVDGSEIGSDTADVGSLGSISYLYVGARSTVEYWNGVIDEVIIWERALSSAEVSNLYNQYQ